MDEFCGATFWDLNLTWYTGEDASPDFTPCFESTILSWIPCVYLWLFAPWSIYDHWNSQLKQIPWTCLNALKLSILLLLSVLSMVPFFRNVYLSQIGTILYPVHFVTPLVSIATFMLMSYVVLRDKAKGIRTSGTQFYFWLLLTCCQLFSFRTQILISQDPERESDTFEFVLQMISYPLIVAELLLSCWIDAAPSFISPKELEPCPELSSSYLSQLFFSWFDALAWKGYKKPLEQVDIWDLNNDEKSHALTPKFDKHWKRLKTKLTSSSEKQGNKETPIAQIELTSTNNKPPQLDKDKDKAQRAQPYVNILPVLFGAFGSTFVFGAFIRLIADILIFVSPEILKRLIAFVSSDEELWKGFLYTAILFITNVAQTLLMSQYFIRMFISGMRVRTVLVSAIFRKALLLSNSARNSSTVGEIVNLMSVDAQKIQDILPHICQLWSSPLLIALSMYFLWQTLGPSVLAGLAFMILLIPINSFIATKMKKFQIIQMKRKDERVKLMNEILSGIKALKLYAWERSFEEQILVIRKKEMRVLRNALYLHNAISFVWQCAPFLVSLVTFATYVLIDEKNVLDAQKAFVSLSLFNILKRPLTMLPMVITFLVQASVSLKRVNNFMNAEEIDQTTVSHDPNEKDQILIENGTFSWTDERVTLKNIDVHIQEGSLCAIIGEIGSGKSSLLSAILGELDKSSGRVNTKGTIAYVGQQAWIQNATLKQNILFSNPLDWQKYDKVIKSCALQPDLEILPGGDNTEIGEKGINLSGGQKQRVALARSVYNNSDVYLMDDPLSAVDSHVGKHIFEQVIGPQGMLKKKTRVLVTHGITYLSQMDQIIVMSGGEVTESGTYKELLSKKGEFSEFLIRHLEQLDEVENGELAIIHDIEEIVGSEQASKILTRQFSRQSSDHPEGSRKELLLRQQSTQSERSYQSSLTKLAAGSLKNIPKEGEKLIGKETSEIGSTDKKSYFYYIKSIGWEVSVAVLSLNILFEACATLSNVWLSKWSDEPSINGTQNIGQRDLYLSVFGALGTGQVFACLVGGLILTYGTIRAASVLHNDMLRRILRAPPVFFDTTPTGRIVNRFAKDVDTCDSTLPHNVRDFTVLFIKVIGTLIVISASTPLFVVAIIPISLVYLALQRFYVATSRQLKRLDSVSRSPIYSHFTEAITGCSTIRAFGVQERFILESESNVDCNQRAYFAQIVSNRWISIRLEGMGDIIILFASLFSVLGRGTVSPGIVGLSITYALQLTMILNWAVRMSSDVESNMVAVERLKEYSEVVQEAPDEIETTKPSKSWPNLGRIEFERYQTRYREGLDLVLHDVSVVIEPGEKVGIVGRTGSGKSSFALSLFRLLESAGGSIIIDGKDISTIGLFDLRSRLTIIPQDPVLFSGTLRMNLDPFSEYDDETVWRSLELAHLKPFVKGLDGGLNYDISEGGLNLSVGQRQLICLARALLRKSKILVLDEATAQVDLDTDELIQETIRKEFKDSTILTIAHRLNTIMDYTRVMVLDKGEIKEFERPAVLLKDMNSMFYKMAKDAGVIQ